MDNKIRRLDIIRWFLAAFVGYLIVIVITMFVIGCMDSIALKNAGVTDGPIWEWDMKQFRERSSSHNDQYDFVFYLYLGIALVSIPVRLLQSRYLLVLEEKGIACRTLGKVRKIGYREIADIQSFSIPTSTNGCLVLLATVIPPLAMFSTLKITGSIRNAKGIYQKVSIRYYYIGDPKFVAIQIRNKMNAVTPSRQ